MSGPERDRPGAGGRRPPPAFRPVEVVLTDRLSPRLGRVTLSGPALEGLVVDQPAASVRVLLPSPPEREPVMPVWSGNAFLLPDGRRPVIRTLTPRHLDAEKLRLDVDVVLHGAGAASQWAQAARPGDRSAVSGPARGYTVDPDAPSFFLAGDETAIPAIGQLLERLPAGKPVHVEIEVAEPGVRMVLPERSGVEVIWLDLPADASPGTALVAAVGGADLGPETRVWVAGEAAAVQRIRRLLFEERGLPRSRATVRGYWKHGRAGSAED